MITIKAILSALFLDLASAYTLIKGEVRRTALPRDRMLILYLNLYLYAECCLYFVIDQERSDMRR